ncbi:MAG TPA: arginase family protein [Bryobacteraceae bacterium]|nr:arginase family protein [Bryobacteraceae bacterium]
MLRPASPTFCNAPAWHEGGQWDVVVLGIPSACGAVGSARSAATGPSAIRSASRIYPIVPRADGNPAGWFDYSLGEALLEGSSIADAGDLVVERYDPLAGLSKIPFIVRELKKTARTLLILGGDHSITYWTAQAMPDTSALFFFDAHEDATAAIGTNPHCGNVVSFLEQLPNLSTIAQYGLRGLVPALRREPADHRRLCATLADLERTARACVHRPAQLSIDVDVLDPSIMRSVASPSPGGLRQTDLLAGVSAITENGPQIDIVEIVEFAPLQGEDPLTAMLVAELALRVLHRCIRA